jgi:hypothetical protein
MNSKITSLEQEAILRLTEEFFAVSIASKTKKNLVLLATDLRPANATNCVFRSARAKTSSCLDFRWRECLLRVGTWQRATSPRSPGLAATAASMTLLRLLRQFLYRLVPGAMLDCTGLNRACDELADLLVSRATFASSRAADEPVERTAFGGL